MKKMMKDKSFWLILVISIVTLIALIVGVIFLTRQNSREFYSAGYIIDSTASKSDKYYFSDKTVYKENVFNEYVFKDVDNKEVSTAKDNFIHYLDNSLSFMKNGVILDLDNFNQNIAPYYNITDKSIIKYNNGGYYIETADKTLVFGNFLGRITDNKYIVVGNDISVKLAGNDKPVEGSYFEILFVEDGIVKIENQEGSYQTISEGTVIYIGDNIKIDLGDKSLNYGEEAKLNLTELTIDGNENIDIVPEEELVDKGEKPEDGAGNGNETDTGNNIGEDSGNREPDEGNNEENDKPNGETNTVLKKEVAVNLIDAETTVNSIKAKFQVIDTMEAIKGNLVLTIVNTTTGDTVYTKLLSNTPEEQLISVSALDSNCNYVMKIVDETNEVSTQYFQKSFRTKSLDLILKREMVTEDSLTYYLDFGSNNDVTKATVSIYVQNSEVPFKSYPVEKENNKPVTFYDLKSNTIYEVKVHDVYIETTPYSRYEIATSDITLKKKPELGKNIEVDINNDANIFTLKSDFASVIDEDDAIVKYTYQIFEGVSLENQDTIKPVYSFDRTELQDETLKIGETTGLKGNTDYWFNIIATYNDNYRHNVVKSVLSAPFNVIGLPTISFEPEVIGTNRISGYVIIHDEGCTVPFKGRECYDEPNNFVITINGGKDKIYEDEIIQNVIAYGDSQTLLFDVSGLESGTKYYFNVYATVDKKNGEKPIVGYPLGYIPLETADKNALKVDWTPNEYSDDNPVPMSVSIKSNNDTSESYKDLSRITFNLYKGKILEKDIKDAIPIATFTDSEDVLDKYYLKNYPLDFSMFEYDENLVSPESTTSVDILRDLSGGKLVNSYTIQLTDAYDDFIGRYDIIGGVKPYEIPKMVLMRENVLEPTINVLPIYNNDPELKNGEYSSYGLEYIEELAADNSVRGYKVTSTFDKSAIESIMENSNAITSVNFYAKDVNTGFEFDPIIIDDFDDGYVTAIFALQRGTDYYTEDQVMTRGNTYTFSVDLTIDDNGNNKNFPQTKVSYLEEQTALKTKPIFKYYIDNSKANSISYKYVVTDYDEALYSEDGKFYINYNVNGSEEVFEPIEYYKDGTDNVFTLIGLNNGNIYNFGYSYALDKRETSIVDEYYSYYFDGYYNLKDELEYELVQKKDSNQLKIMINENQFLDRISAYILTLSVDGISKKYEKVISNLDDCDGNKCIIVNYTELNTGDYLYKGKNINVKLEAFYDNGYVGFSQESLLGNYFSNLGYVDEENASKVGFVYQTDNDTGPGQYFYIRNGGFVTTDSGDVAFYNYPRGILGFEFKNTTLNTTNLVDEKNETFASFDTIKYNDVIIVNSSKLGGISLTGMSKPFTFSPKVLDKASLNGEESFKFTSIIPNVYTMNINSLINGAFMDIIIDGVNNENNDVLNYDILRTDYMIGENGKYNFYIDIYKETICSEEDAKEDGCTVGKKYRKEIDSVPTDHEHLKGVYFEGLEPATTYIYEISADMNKDGKSVKTKLFTSDGIIFDSKLTTLKKEQILLNPDSNVRYNVKSFINEERYSNRILNFTTILNSNYKNQLINFDLKYTLTNENGIEFEKIIYEDEIDRENTVKAEFSQDVTGDDFVFGENYHELVITAVTKDLHKELELYRAKLVYNGYPKEFGILDSYVNENKFNYDESRFTITYINESKFNSDNNVHSIKSTINIKDTDKVVKDGMFYVRLQNGVGSNLLECVDGDTNCKLECSIPSDDEKYNPFENNCRLSIKIEKVLDEKDNTYKFKGTCLDKDKYKNVSSCDVIPSSNGDDYVINVVFSNLKPDISYSIVTQAKTYSKNYYNGMLEPNQNVSVFSETFTNSSLGFSLGEHVAIFDNNNKKLNLVFQNSSNVKKSLVGIKYYIKGADNALLEIDSGTIGKTNVGEVVDDNYKLTYDYDYLGKHPSILIPIKEEAKNKIDNSNRIHVFYYYRDANGKVANLMFDENNYKTYSFADPGKIK